MLNSKNNTHSKIFFIYAMCAFHLPCHGMQEEVRRQPGDTTFQLVTNGALNAGLQLALAHSTYRATNYAIDLYSKKNSYIMFETLFLISTLIFVSNYQNVKFGNKRSVKLGSVANINFHLFLIKLCYDSLYPLSEVFKLGM